VFVCYVQGQGVENSKAMQGMVFKRQVEGDIKKSENCKVAVYTCPLDIMQTETKVLIYFYCLYKSWEYLFSVVL